jgi:hypothetical protein
MLDRDGERAARVLDVRLAFREALAGIESEHEVKRKPGARRELVDEVLRRVRRHDHLQARCAQQLERGARRCCHRGRVTHGALAHLELRRRRIVFGVTGMNDIELLAKRDPRRLEVAPPSVCRVEAVSRRHDLGCEIGEPAHRVDQRAVEVEHDGSHDRRHRGQAA